MKTSINFSTFCDAFRDADRNENFSYDGKRILFNYIEEYEESTGEEIELDVVALCCEFSEADASEIAEDYSIDVEDMDEDEMREAVEEYLNKNTLLVGVTDSGGFVYAAF